MMGRPFFAAASVLALPSAVAMTCVTLLVTEEVTRPPRSSINRRTSAWE